MQNINNFKIEEEVKREAKSGVVSQITGFLAALLPVLSIAGYQFDWFTQDFINSIGVLLSAGISLVVTCMAIYKNHFSSKKAQKQNKALKQKGLK
ncbi:phage holin [Virgibacillus siamensis]|uniref:phage holin n=1 Tax=Virgibacillus siamensis TaxID=480071 RepID=UPI000985D705|nr:phage holin [Virgibacillus siamensis]